MQARFQKKSKATHFARNFFPHFFIHSHSNPGHAIIRLTSVPRQFVGKLLELSTASLDMAAYFLGADEFAAFRAGWH